MSVYKSQRNQSDAEFIKHARELRIMTIKTVARFPRRYQHSVTDLVLDTASNIYDNCIKANTIYLTRYTKQQDFDLRHRYLILATTNLGSLQYQIDFLYDLVDDGNNYFKSKSEYDKIFQRWMDETLLTERLIKALIKSDNTRYKEYKEHKEESLKETAQNTITETPKIDIPVYNEDKLF